MAQQKCYKVNTGKDRVLLISALLPGCAPPILNLSTAGGVQPEFSWDVPLNASVTATIAKGAVSIAMGALPAGLTQIFIPEGFVVPFINTDKTVVPVTLTADYTGGAAISCKATGRAIKVGAVLRYPIAIGGAVDVNYNPSNSVVASNGGGTNGFNAKAPGSADATMDGTIEVDFLDAAIQNISLYRKGGGSLWAVCAYLGGATDYTPFWVEGPIFIGSQALPSPRNGIVSGTVQMPFSDDPTEHQPEPVAP